VSGVGLEVPSEGALVRRGLAGELHAFREARTIVEGRYLDGHPALFPDLAAAWETQVKDTQTVATRLPTLAEFAGIPASVAADPEAASARAVSLWRISWSRQVRALQKLGEGERAYGIANECCGLSRPEVGRTGVIGNHWLERPRQPPN